jgi:4a-hydroxytetrahydrobiopterin dehydratase
LLPELLNQEEIDRRASQLQNWKIIDQHHLVGVYQFGNFAEALEFTRRVGDVGEDLQHHPEIDLSWGRVEITIFTHDRDGLTELDFKFAARVEAAFNRDDEDEVGNLVGLLEYGDFLEKREAARKLGSLKDSRAVPPLIKALLKDEDVALSRRAARSLGRLNDRRAVDPLIEMLKNEDDLLRQYARDSLVELDEFSVPGLLKAVKSSDKRKRKLAIGALLEIRDDEDLQLE